MSSNKMQIEDDDKFQNLSSHSSKHTSQSRVKQPIVMTGEQDVSSKKSEDTLGDFFQEIYKKEAQIYQAKSCSHEPVCLTTGYSARIESLTPQKVSDPIYVYVTKQAQGNQPQSSSLKNSVKSFSKTSKKTLKHQGQGKVQYEATYGKKSTGSSIRGSKKSSFIDVQISPPSSFYDVRSEKQHVQLDIQGKYYPTDSGSDSSDDEIVILPDGEAKLVKPFEDGFFPEKKSMKAADSYFDDDLSSVSSEESTIYTTLTVSQDQIWQKINIISNKKIQIVSKASTIQDIPQTAFKKKVPEIEENVTTTKVNEMETISIEKLFQGENSLNSLNKFSQADPTNKMSYMICREILNSNDNQVDQKISDQIKTKIENSSKQQPNSLFTILLFLEKFIKDVNKDMKVIFCEKSTLKTQVSLKIISTGFAFQKFKCSQKMSQQKYTSFQNLINISGKYKAFQEWYEEQVHKNYKVPVKNVKLTSIQKLKNGKICVQWDTYEPQLIYKSQKAKKRIKVSPYFKKFYLSIEDFDTKNGNMTFPDEQIKCYMRGKLPYYMPERCSRFSIQVWNKFDDGNNEWLSMGNKPNEWCSVFFGLYNPKSQEFVKKVMDHSLSEASTIFQQDLPIQIIKNIVKNKKSKNKKQDVGEGIICTPYMWNALRSAHEITVNNEKYFCVFQCRANPKKLKITQNENYWVVNQFCDIRPYGIILVKASVKQSYPRPQKRFKRLFSYDDWKQDIQKDEQTKSTYETKQQ